VGQDRAESWAARPFGRKRIVKPPWTGAIGHIDVVVLPTRDGRQPLERPTPTQREDRPRTRSPARGSDPPPGRAPLTSSGRSWIPSVRKKHDFRLQVEGGAQGCGVIGAADGLDGREPGADAILVLGSGRHQASLSRVILEDGGLQVVEDHGRTGRPAGAGRGWRAIRAWPGRAPPFSLMLPEQSMT